MEGAARELFVPLSLAVGFAMIASYLLSSTFVPVLSTWLLQAGGHAVAHGSTPAHGWRRWFRFDAWRAVHEAGVAWLVRLRWLVVPGYLSVCGAAVSSVGGRAGHGDLPRGRRGRVSACGCGARRHAHRRRPNNSPWTSCNMIEELVGPSNVALTLGYVGTIPSSYPDQRHLPVVARARRRPISAIALKPGSGIGSRGH